RTWVQFRHADAHQRAFARMAADIQRRGIAVKHLQTFADVAESDAMAARGNLLGHHAATIVLDFQFDLSGEAAGAKSDGAAGELGGEAMADGVLDNRLQQHAGHEDVEGVGINALFNAEFFRSEAHDLDVEVVVHEGELFAQRLEALVLAQHAAQNVGEFDDHDPGGVRIETHERGHRIERIEQKVRIDLTGEGIEAGLNQQAALGFELALDTGVVPDLDGNRNGENVGGGDGGGAPEGVGLGGVEARRHEALELDLERGGSNEDQEGKGLPIAEWAIQAIAQPAPELEIDEGGEGPDFLGAGCGAAQQATREASGGEERQRQPLTGSDQRGQGNERAAEGAGVEAADKADQERAGEAEVRSLEAGNGETDPNSAHQRESEEEGEGKALGQAAAILEQVALEGERAHEHGGDGGDDAEVEQQRDQQEALGAHAPIIRAESEMPMAAVELRLAAEASFPTRWGAFRILGFELGPDSAVVL